MDTKGCSARPSRNGGWTRAGVEGQKMGPRGQSGCSPATRLANASTPKSFNQTPIHNFFRRFSISSPRTKICTGQQKTHLPKARDHRLDRGPARICYRTDPVWKPNPRSPPTSAQPSCSSAPSDLIRAPKQTSPFVDKQSARPSTPTQPR